MTTPDAAAPAVTTQAAHGAGSGIHLWQAARRLIPFACIGIAGIILAWSLANMAERDALDFLGYRASEARLLAGQSLYAPLQLAGPYELSANAGTVFVYPPPAVALFLPLSVIGLNAWRLIGVAVLIGGLLSVVQRERGTVTLTSVGLVVLGAALYVPVLDALVVGSVTPIVTGVLAFAYGWNSGVTGGLGALLKVTPGFMAVIDGWRGARTALLVAAGISAASVLLMGVGPWQDFARALGNGQPSCGLFDSLTCAAAPVIGMSAAKLLALGVGGTIAGAALLVPSRPVRLALVTVALLATSTEIAWPRQYYLYALPLLVMLLARPVRRSGRAGVA